MVSDSTGAYDIQLHKIKKQHVDLVEVNEKRYSDYEEQLPMAAESLEPYGVD
jgi:hypothetical protein